MSGMILCRSKEADTPLYLSDTGVKIYSLEELCYYIYNNIYIIGTEFINDRLLEFIEFETKEKPLADMLSQMMERHAGLAEMVVAILKYVDYYSISEIEAIKGILNTLGTKNVFERLKLRADRFLENKCYYSAIKNYLMITKEKGTLRFREFFMQRFIIMRALLMLRCFFTVRRILSLKRHTD